MRSRVGSALVLCAMFMACDADEAVPAASTTSTAFVEPVSTAPSTAPTTSTAIPSSVPNEVVVESAVYTCGPTDGSFIEALVSSRREQSVVIELVTVDGVSGASDLTLLPAAVATKVGFDAALSAAVYDAEFAEVRVRAPGPSGDVPVLDTAEVRLRFAPGVGCG